MKNINKYSKIIIAIFDLIFIIIWISGKNKNQQTMEILQKIWDNISLIMIILLTLSLIVLWVIGKTRDSRNYKNKYFDLIEDKIEFNKTNLDFLRLKDILGRQPDYSDLAKNFSDESLKSLGYDDKQIRRINKYRTNESD